MPSSSSEKDFRKESISTLLQCETSVPSSWCGLLLDFWMSSGGLNTFSWELEIELDRLRYQWCLFLRKQWRFLLRKPYRWFKPVDLVWKQTTRLEIGFQTVYILGTSEIQFYWCSMKWIDLLYRLEAWEQLAIARIAIKSICIRILRSSIDFRVICYHAR